MALNVDWDAFVHFKSLAFKNMFEWLKFTVDYFERNKNKNLIIRAHPGELLEMFHPLLLQINILSLITQTYLKILNLLILFLPQYI